MVREKRATTSIDSGFAIGFLWVPFLPQREVKDKEL